MLLKKEIHIFKLFIHYYLGVKRSRNGTDKSGRFTDILPWTYAINLIWNFQIIHHIWAFWIPTMRSKTSALGVLHRHLPEWQTVG